MLPFPRIFNTTIIPPPRYNVLLSMHDFNTNADIIDKSTNNITIGKGVDVSVGANQYGTYMNFNGNNGSYLTFKDNKLAIGTNMEMYFKISGLVYRGGQYLQLLMDTRPAGVNGNYFLFGYTSNAVSPFKTYLNINNTGESYSTQTFTSDANTPMEIRIRLLSTGTYVYINNVLFHTNPQVLNINTLQNYCIGRNAFFGTASVPYLSGKIYAFEIRQLL